MSAGHAPSVGSREGSISARLGWLLVWLLTSSFHVALSPGTGPAACHKKAKLARQVLVERKVDFFQAPASQEDGGLRSQSSSSHIRAGRGFYEEGEGKQDKEIDGRG